MSGRATETCRDLLIGRTSLLVADLGSSPIEGQGGKLLFMKVSAHLLRIVLQLCISAGRDLEPCCQPSHGVSCCCCCFSETKKGEPTLVFVHFLILQQNARDQIICKQLKFIWLIVLSAGKSKNLVWHLAFSLHHNMVEEQVSMPETERTSSCTPTITA